HGGDPRVVYRHLLFEAGLESRLESLDAIRRQARRRLELRYCNGPGRWVRARVCCRQALVHARDNGGDPVVSGSYAQAALDRSTRKVLAVRVERRGAGGIEVDRLNLAAVQPQGDMQRVRPEWTQAVEVDAEE